MRFSLILVFSLMASGAVAGHGNMSVDLASPTDRLHALVQDDVIQSAARFNCADVSCKRLGSCDEACYKYIQCGQSKRDGDHDGIPCENLCHRPCPR